MKILPEARQRAESRETNGSVRAGHTVGEVMNMDIMDEYYHDKRLPEGFREALGKNGKALEYWSAMTPEERRRRTQAIQGLHSAREIEEYVNAMVGWEVGHPPFQL